MSLGAGAAVLDLGCGAGTTTRLLAERFGFIATGVDASQRNIDLASELADSANVDFVRGDAGHLPFGHSAFDGAIAECVLSILDDKSGALRELRRVLKPGGCLALTDMSITRALQDDLAAVAEPWTCIADARDRRGYESLFEDAGFDLLGSFDESETLTTMSRGLKRKLLLSAAGGIASGEFPFDIASARYWLDRFGAAVGDGTIRFLRFHLRR